MRLIDADRLKPDVQAWTAEKKFEYRYSPEVINNAPTVEAIPIVWLNKVIEHYRENGWHEDAEDLELLINDWREEQENACLPTKQ